MKISKYLLAAILSIVSGLWVVGAVAAQQPTPSDDQVNAIAKQLYCPVCENIPLDVCPTTACAQWRELIREKLAQGWSEQQIKDYFVLQYGDRVVGTPPAKGINTLVYIVPPMIILAGIYVLVRTFMAWKRPIQENTQPTNNPVNPTSPDQDEYLRRMEDEVKKQ